MDDTLKNPCNSPSTAHGSPHHDDNLQGDDQGNEDQSYEDAKPDTLATVNLSNDTETPGDEESKRAELTHGTPLVVPENAAEVVTEDVVHDGSIGVQDDEGQTMETDDPQGSNNDDIPAAEVPEQESFDCVKEIPEMAQDSILPHGQSEGEKLPQNTEGSGETTLLDDFDHHSEKSAHDATDAENEPEAAEVIEEMQQSEQDLENPTSMNTKRGRGWSQPSITGISNCMLTLKTLLAMVPELGTVSRPSRRAATPEPAQPPTKDFIELDSPIVYSVSPDRPTKTSLHVVRRHTKRPRESPTPIEGRARRQLQASGPHWEQRHSGLKRHDRPGRPDDMYHTDQPSVRRGIDGPIAVRRYALDGYHSPLHMETGDLEDVDMVPLRRPSRRIAVLEQPHTSPRHPAGPNIGQNSFEPYPRSQRPAFQNHNARSSMNLDEDGKVIAPIAIDDIQDAGSTNAICIENLNSAFVRDKLPDVLSEFGKVINFWISEDDTKCHAQYATVRAAVDTLHRLSRVRLRTGQLLRVSYADPAVLSRHLSQHHSSDNFSPSRRDTFGRHQTRRDPDTLHPSNSRRNYHTNYAPANDPIPPPVDHHQDLPYSSRQMYADRPFPRAPRDHPVSPPSRRHDAPLPPDPRTNSRNNSHPIGRTHDPSSTARRNVRPQEGWDPMPPPHDAPAARQPIIPDAQPKSVSQQPADLEKLFLRTKAKPRLYYLPNREEVVSRNRQFAFSVLQKAEEEQKK